jgi:hypothetical protein
MIIVAIMADAAVAVIGGTFLSLLLMMEYIVHINIATSINKSPLLYEPLNTCPRFPLVRIIKTPIREIPIPTICPLEILSLRMMAAKIAIIAGFRALTKAAFVEEV